MRRRLLALLLLGGLVLPAAAYAGYQGTIGNDPTIVYSGTDPTETVARTRLLSNTYTGSGGVTRCIFRRVVEYQPVINTSLYELEYTPSGSSTHYVYNWFWNDAGGYPRDPGATALPGGALTDGTTSATYTPEPGWRFTSAFFSTNWSDLPGPCPTDPSAGYAIVRMVGWVSTLFGPPATPTPSPAPGGPQTPGATPTPTPAPADPQLELLPRADYGPARLQDADGLDGAPAQITVIRDGKTYRAENNSTFAVGDIIKVGPRTVVTLEYAIGGRVSLTPGAEVKVIGDRRIELLGGTTEISVPDRKDPLEIQTNGGTMGIKG